MIESRGGRVWIDLTSEFGNRDDNRALPIISSTANQSGCADARSQAKIPISLFADSSSMDNRDGRSQCNIWRGVNDVDRVCQRRSHTSFHDALLREGGGRHPSSSLLSPQQRCATVDHLKTWLSLTRYMARSGFCQEISPVKQTSIG